MKTNILKLVDFKKDFNQMKDSKLKVSGEINFAIDKKVPQETQDFISDKLKALMIEYKILDLNVRLIPNLEE